MPNGGDKPMTQEEALKRASEFVRRTDDRVWDWLRQGQRVVFIVATGIVLTIALLLDGFGGDKEAKMAGHLIDLAKFVLPAVLASSAVAGYSKSRLLCCVMQHGPSESESTGP